MHTNSIVYPYASILAAPSLNELSKAVHGLVGDAGFSSFHYGMHTPVKATGDKARFLFDGTEQQSIHVLSDYPESWFARYQSEKYIEVDPLVQHCSQSILPAVWHQQQEPGSLKAGKMFDEAKQHGLVAGATFSVLGKDHEFGIFSLTIDSNREKDKRNVVNHLGHGYMLLVHLHEAMKRLRFPENLKHQTVALTPRERECLVWVSTGKPSWEIAQLLRISERTAIYHIHNATRKLGANTRRQAVARATALGLIHP